MNTSQYISIIYINYLFVPCVSWNADGYGYGGGSYDGGYSGGRGGARGKGTHCSVLSLLHFYIYLHTYRFLNGIL